MNKKKNDVLTERRVLKYKNKKKTNWVKVIIWTGVYLNLVFVAFIAGMIYQQVLFAEEINMFLSKTNIDIDVNFNATEFTRELNRTFIPAWKEAFNETMHNQLNLTKNE